MNAPFHMPVPVEPPHAIAAEQALLGAALHNPDALDKARGALEPEDFAEEIHCAIFRAMCEARDRGAVIDGTLVRTAIGDRDLGEGVSLGGYIARLYAGATTILNAPDYARAIRNAAMMRQVLATARDAVAAMTTGAVADPSAYAASMIEALDAVAASGKPEGLKRVSIANASAIAIQAAAEAQRGTIRRGAPYGIPALDRKTLGMRPGQFIVIAGRPGMGKSTAGVAFALSAAQAGHGAYFVSLEMTAQELGERALAALCYDPRQAPLSYRAIAEGRELSDDDFRRLESAHDRLLSRPCEIEQQAGLSVAQIIARARQLKAQWQRKGARLSVVIIDHLGLIRPSKRYAGNRVQELTEITAALKEAAKDLDVAMVALCQLSREVEKRQDKRPMLSDLRDSGSIEQDADVVIGLYREAYYLENKEALTDEERVRLLESENVLEAAILKQRQGPTGPVRLFCSIQCNMIAELAS